MLEGLVDVFFRFFCSDGVEDAEIKCPNRRIDSGVHDLTSNVQKKEDICEAQGVHHVITAQPTKETLRVCRLSCHFQFFSAWSW